MSTSSGTKSNPSVQRTEASRLAHSQFVAQWWLAPAADADRQGRCAQFMKATSHITKAGGWLFCFSLGFTVLVCCLSQDWALSSPDGLIGHPHRIEPPVYGLLLFAVWALAYLIGWLGLRARGIRATRKPAEAA